MLRWLLRKPLEGKADEAINWGREVVEGYQRKSCKEGPRTILFMAEGVGQVARMLAERFGISISAVLEMKGLPWKVLCHAGDDLMESAQESHSLRDSPSSTARNMAVQLGMASSLFASLCWLRVIEKHGPVSKRVEAARVGDRVALYARVMVEIGAGLRDPSDAYGDD